MQIACGGWNVRHSLRDSLYMMPEHVKSNDAMTLAYDNQTRRNVQNKHKVILDNKDPLHFLDERGGAENNMSINKGTLEMTEKRTKSCGRMSRLLDACAGLERLR